MDFDAAIERIRAQLAARPPCLLNFSDRFLDVIQHHPKRLIELHGLHLLRSRAERRRMEARLPPHRQAIALVFGALLIDMDIPSMRSGYRRGDGEFSGRGHAWIAELTGLTERRVRRAIFSLKLAGYLHGKQPREPYLPPGATSRDEVRYCAHNSIYRFDPKVFKQIGRDRRLKRERATATERRKNRGRLYAASLVNARRALRRFRTSNSPTPAPVAPRPPDPAPSQRR